MSTYCGGFMRSHRIGLRFDRGFKIVEFAFVFWLYYFIAMKKSVSSALIAGCLTLFVTALVILSTQQTLSVGLARFQNVGDIFVLGGFKLCLGWHNCCRGPFLGIPFCPLVGKR